MNPIVGRTRAGRVPKLRVSNSPMDRVLRGSAADVALGGPAVGDVDLVGMMVHRGSLGALGMAGRWGRRGPEAQFACEARSRIIGPPSSGIEDVVGEQWC